MFQGTVATYTTKEYREQNGVVVRAVLLRFTLWRFRKRKLGYPSSTRFTATQNSA